MTSAPTPESFLPLKPHWFHVLVSLSDQDQHGYGIMLDVLERTDGKVRLWPPTLYGTIKRLIEADLVAPSESQPAADLDDARRRYYRISPLGRRVLSAECASRRTHSRGPRAARRPNEAGVDARSPFAREILRAHARPSRRELHRRSR